MQCIQISRYEEHCASKIKHLNSNESGNSMQKLKRITVRLKSNEQVMKMTFRSGSYQITAELYTKTESCPKHHTCVLVRHLHCPMEGPFSRSINNPTLLGDILHIYLKIVFQQNIDQKNSKAQRPINLILTLPIRPHKNFIALQQ